MEDNEIKTLLSLHHENVVRVYTTESDDNLMFRYIAMELADMSFADYIGRKYEEEFRGSNSDIIFLKQIAEGLEYLHSKNIIHSNIRPQNALISSPIWPNSDRKAKISDFAFEKELAQKSTSMIFRTDDGWMAREILRSRTKTIIPTKEMDIFALGCLFYYVLNDGKHPFGGQFYRQANILNDRPKMVELKNENSLCKYHLIQAMINKEPSNRPSTNAVLKHPIFWDSETTLSFIVNVSNFLMEEKKKKDSPLLINLEKNATVVTRNNWMNHIPEELKVELQSDRHRSYNESSVQNLLRMIRNKYQHWGELNDKVKQALGSMPDGYVNFFTKKFPRLLIHTYIIFQNNCKKENTFKDYFCDSFDFQDLPTANLGDST
jgi:serine/threonine protein kinase